MDMDNPYQPHEDDEKIHNHDHSLQLDTLPPGTRTTRPKRIMYDMILLFCILFMLLWPWVFFAVVNAKNGIQMNNQLSEKVSRYPHQVGAVVTFIGTVNRVIATYLFGRTVVRLGQELIARGSEPEVTVFGVSALLAFRHMTLVWGPRQWKQLVKGRDRFAVVVLLLAALAALALIPSGTASLITPAEFHKTAELKGTELDFTADNPECLSWLETNGVTNLCDWKTFRNASFTTCLGENQILDVLDSGRANMLSVIGIKNETSSLNQLGTQGGIRFLGSAKGVLPNGPNGIPAFNTLKPEANPFADTAVRKGMVSYNYTLSQQGLETNVSCFFDSKSPISYRPLETSTRIIVTAGTCDPAAGLEPVLENVVDYPTLNTNNTLTYWACKQPPHPGSTEDPTYFIYLRGRAYYERYTDGGLIGLGNIIWEGQNWASHLVAEAVFSTGTKDLNLQSHEIQSPMHLKLFEGMIQGILEYQATYSRLIYSLGENPPPSCLRPVKGSVSYYVRGWFIDDSPAQTGLLIPMTLINLTSLGLLIACFFMGKLTYRYDFDATDSLSLLTALVVNVRHGRDGKIGWHNKVHYGVEQAKD